MVCAEARLSIPVGTVPVEFEVVPAVWFVSIKSAGGDGEKPERGTYRA